MHRRQAIVDLLANTSALAKQLSGLVADNEKELAPTLEKLNSVTAMLEKNRDNIGKALPGLAKFELTQGETVANGLYYNAFVPNLHPSANLQPFLDYLFGFRRGINAGQPPDHRRAAGGVPLPVQRYSREASPMMARKRLAAAVGDRPGGAHRCGSGLLRP